MNVAEILRKCPNGTKLYSSIFGELSFLYFMSCSLYPLYCKVIRSGYIVSFTEDGKRNITDAEPTLFPSRTQRDWSKFGMTNQVTDKETERQLKQSEKVLVPNDMKINKKCVPFDIELAKKIMNKEVKGRIVTREGLQVRIVCFDLKGDKWPIVAIIQTPGNYEVIKTYESNGRYGNFGEEQNDLLIEVPTDYRDYSNFVPQKWQLCLVRNNALSKWVVAVCARKDKNTGKILFYNEYGGTNTWGQTLPLTKVTKWLIGMNKSYEQLCEELDQKMEKKL